MHFHIYCSIIQITKIWKQPKCVSVDEWIKKMWGVHVRVYVEHIYHIYKYHIYMWDSGILFCHEKEGNLAICDNMVGL